MLMLLRILGRLGKSLARVLVVGWTPAPPEDFAGRLDAVEKKAEATRQKVYRDGKADEAAASSLPAAVPESFPAANTPRHSDGTPVRHGDHPY